MKTRLLWIAILAIGGTALYFGIAQPHVTSIPKNIRDPIADLKPADPLPIEPPALVIPTTPTVTLPPMRVVAPPPVRPVARLDPIPVRPEVPIQNGATIDFSTGLPLVKSHGKDQDALETALREIAESAKGTSFEAKK